jgi:hypothetical protein
MLKAIKFIRKQVKTTNRFGTYVPSYCIRKRDLNIKHRGPAAGRQAPEAALMEE